MKNRSILPYILVLIAGILFGLSWNLQRKTSKELVENPNSPFVQENNKTSPISSQTISEIEQSTINLFESSVSSVAFITTSTVRRDYWNRNISEMPSGSGSGFVWDDAGHIVTNFHVIQGADKAIVTLHDQTSYEAELVGVAPDKDLAVLKILVPKETLYPISKGQSNNLQVGQSVFAIGNPFGLDYTLTTGIISALGREINSVSSVKIKDVIQTDAAINPGNSGGPLLNSSGQLIGVNTAIYSPSGAYAGIGFSIPVDVVSYVIPDLIQFGYIKKPVLGVELLPSGQNQIRVQGALIINVIPGKGADQAGLVGTSRDSNGRMEIGDIITSINDEKINNNSDLVLALENYQVGDIVRVGINRQGKAIEKEVKLSEN